MKLGRTAKIILIVGGFAIGFYLIYGMKTDAERVQKNLEIQLNATEQVLPQLASQKEELREELAILEADLAEAEAAMKETEGLFPADTQSIEYDEEIFRIAHQKDLEVMMVTATEPRRENINDFEFTRTDFIIKLEGMKSEQEIDQTEKDFEYYIYQTVDDILAYLNSTINNSFFSTSSIEMVNIKVPEVPVIEDEETEDTDTGNSDNGEEEEIELIEPSPASATISINVYSYGGEEY